MSAHGVYCGGSKFSVIQRFFVISPDSPIISISNLSKTYATGFHALKNINLDIRRGEIFALLGPNGAGKTTLIGIVCGIVNPSEGTVKVDGYDIVARLSCLALAHWPRSAGTNDRRIRDGMGDVLL